MPRPLEPRDPDYEAAVRDSFAQQGLMTTLGARLARVEPGAVDIELRCSPAVSQQDGFVHGGATTSVLDTACGYAAMTLVAAGVRGLTVDFSVHLLEPAQGERVVAEGRVVRGGRLLTVSRGEAYAEQGAERTLVAVMTATIVTIEPRA